MIFERGNFAALHILVPPSGRKKEQLMTIHETVRKMTDGQRADLTSTMAGAIPPDFSFEEAQTIIGKKGSFVAEIREAFRKRRLSAIPADDVWFDLEVDNNIDPVEVVTSANYDPRGWKYLGPKLSGKQTLRVKLVRLGCVRGLEEAKKKADEMGYRLVEGLARESFKAKFPRPDGKGSVAFGGSEWESPRGSAGVAYLGGFGDEWSSSFYWSTYGFDGNWRWLVVGR